jgi:hypothetical protein
MTALMRDENEVEKRELEKLDLKKRQGSQPDIALKKLGGMALKEYIEKDDWELRKLEY